VNRELVIAILEDMIDDCKGNCLTKDKEALEYAVVVLKKEQEESIPVKETTPEVEVLEQSIVTKLGDSKIIIKSDSVICEVQK